MQLNDRYMIFTIANAQYAVPLAHVREVMPDIEVTPVPLAPNSICGIINIRGRIISVLDLCVRFGFPRANQTDEASILILERKGALLGLRTEIIDSVIELTPEQLSPPPNLSASPQAKFMEAVARTERQLIVILNTEKLFSFDESTAGASGQTSSAVA